MDEKKLKQDQVISQITQYLLTKPYREVFMLIEGLKDASILQPKQAQEEDDDTIS